ncbi:MAG: glycosyltransferase [Bryobacteraceae bacterium]|nr:glycosyltransferase [Bryobacteraceae bacterium]
MAKILHILDRLSGGGPARSLIALAEVQGRLGMPHRHRAVTLLPDAYPYALILAKRAGIHVLRGPDPSALRKEIAGADIVQVHFWNNPYFYEFLRSAWPAMRLLLWSKILGDKPPQVITNLLANYVDFIAVTSPDTLDLPVLEPAVRQSSAAVVPGIADFERLSAFEPRPHDTFNVGYIGTVNRGKIHPNYVAMSEGIDIPNVRFVLCGAAEEELRRAAATLAPDGRFEFRGFVENIKPVLETLDVFGYPLCEDTYATSEKSLQEAMYAGVPPVVFPHGGIRRLVRHGETGLVVHSEAEYREAIQSLYHNPAERRRLGANARAYARRHFSPEEAGRQFDRIYARLMEEPKRERRWEGAGPEESPARRFAESLGGAAAQFPASLSGSDSEAERLIAASSPLLAMGEGGVFHYRAHYPNDPCLRFWSGLILLAQRRFPNAEQELRAAIALGTDPTRVAGYLSAAGAMEPVHD